MIRYAVRALLQGLAENSIVNEQEQAIALEILAAKKRIEALVKCDACTALLVRSSDSK